MRNYRGRIRLENGKWAYVQIPELAEAAKPHIKRIKDRWTSPSCFYHLRNGGHVAALKLHQTNPWYGKIDLSNFFSRVSRNKISRCLKALGYSFRDADDFAVASTVCVDHKVRRFALPFGFVQSPILASVVLDKSELGRCFRRLKKQGATLSVYVDDIIVSSEAEEVVRDALSDIRRAATLSKFAINEAKSLGPTRNLRAFNIDIHLGEMNVAADRFERMCRDVLRFGQGPASNGILGYVRSVNERQASQMAEDFERSFSD